MAPVYRSRLLVCLPSLTQTGGGAWDAIAARARFSLLLHLARPADELPPACCLCSAGRFSSRNSPAPPIPCTSDELLHANNGLAAPIDAASGHEVCLLDASLQLAFQRPFGLQHTLMFQQFSNKPRPASPLWLRILVHGHVSSKPS